MALAVGTPAPDVTFLGTDLKPVSLASFKGQNVVLAFFPAAFTGVCKAELCTIQGALSRLNAVNATVLGVSADLPFANAAFAAENGLTFPVLSDWTLNGIRAFDVELSNFAGVEGLSRSDRATAPSETHARRLRSFRPGHGRSRAHRRPQPPSPRAPNFHGDA